MVTKTIIQEVEIRQCDFCDKVASFNVWGSTCDICERDICDDHLIRPIEGHSFTVCPDCNELDLSEIIFITSEIDKADNKCELEKKKLKSAMRREMDELKQIKRSGKR